MKKELRLLTSVLALVVPFSAGAQFTYTQVPEGLTVQGKIIQPDGLPLEENHVEFNIQVLSPGDEACVLFEEFRTVDMTNSKGQIDFIIGAQQPQTQIVATGLNLPIHKVLKNDSNFSGVLKCAPGFNAYTPAAGHSRKVRVSFKVAEEVVTLSPDFTLRSVPYAFESENALALNGKKAADFLQKTENLTQEKLESLLIPANFDGLLAILNPTSAPPATGSIGIPTSDDASSNAPPSRDGLMRFDSETQTYQVSVGGVWQTLITNNTTLESAQIPGNTVQTEHIVNYSITSSKIADSAITSNKIVNEAITTDKIRNLSVTNSKIADGAITFDKIANNAITTTKILDSAVTSAKIADGTIQTVDLANSIITTPKLVDAAITTEKINNAAVTNDKLATDSVSTDKIVNLNVTNEKLGPKSITTDKIDDKQITTATINDLAVTNAKIDAKAVTSDKIGDSQVTTININNLAVTTAKIDNSAVTTGKIADQNVTTAKIADLNVTTVKIDNSAVTTAKIADGNVTDVKIASVSGSKVTGNIPGLSTGFTGALSGDVTGGQSSTKVQALQGRAVASTAPGANQVLKWNGSQWAPGNDDNTITTVNAGTGLVGGGTGNVTLSLANSGVGAGWYGSSTAVPSFYVDSMGRITAVSLQAIQSGAACGANPHGRVIIGFGSCSSRVFTQCLNGSMINIGTIGSTTCDGDGDGF